MKKLLAAALVVASLSAPALANSPKEQEGWRTEGKWQIPWCENYPAIRWHSFENGWC